MLRRLEEIARISTGYPFRKAVETEPGGDVVLIQIKDLDAAEGVIGSGSVMLSNEDGRYAKHLLQAGDLLFQSRGSRHPVAVVESGLRGIAAMGLHTIRPDRTRVLPDYLAWWLNHPTSQTVFRDDLARGSYIPFVSLGDLAQFRVPVPALDAQRRIAAVNRLRRQERALASKLDQLNQQLVDAATLAAATGKQ
jgi:hypothetical protein